MRKLVARESQSAADSAAATKGTEQRRNRGGRPPTHGLTVLKRAVNGLGGRVIDKRTVLGRTLAAWREDLIGDLGGREAVSTAEAQVIDLAVRTKVMLDGI